MSSFSPVDAALEGFRLTREQPRAVAIWWLARFAFSFAILVAAIAVVGPDLATVQAINPTDSQLSPQAMAAMVKVAPFLCLAAPAELIFFAVLNCAVYRAILRPAEAGFAYLRVGRDELRMVVVAIALFLIWLAFLVVVAVSASVFGVVGGPVTALFGAAIGVAAVPTLFWAYVRLSLAAPMTFRERRVVLFASSQLTRGRFWPLFWSYGLALLLAAVIFLLMFLLSTALLTMLVMATGGAAADLAKALGADATSLKTYLTAPVVVWQLLSSGMTTAFWVIWLAPSAIAYQALSGAAPQQPAASERSGWA